MWCLIVFISLHLPVFLKSNLPVIKTFTMSVQMTHGEGVDQEFVMQSRTLSTETSSTITKNIHYSPEPIEQWHCHWHSILGEEELVLRYLFFILPVPDLASFLSHNTVSMTAQLFAVHGFCPHEQKPKAQTCGAPEQLLVWEVRRLLNLLHGGAPGRRQWLPREQVASGDDEGI